MTHPQNKEVIPPWSIAISAMLAAQLAAALSVNVIDQVGAAGTAWLRMCFGALFLIAFIRPALRSLRRSDLPALLGLGIVSGFLTLFFLSSVQRIPLGTAVAIEFLGPLTVAAVKSPRRSAMVWPAVALCGVVLLTEPWLGKSDILGIAFALAAAACWASYNLLTQKVGDKFSGVSGLSLTIPIAAIAVLPLGVVQLSTSNLTLLVVLAAAGIALLNPVITFGLEMLALRKMTHSAFGTLLSVEPALGVLLGLIVLSQKPTWEQLAGISLVVVAGAAAQRGGTRTQLTN